MAIHFFLPYGSFYNLFVWRLQSFLIVSSVLKYHSDVKWLNYKSIASTFLYISWFLTDWYPSESFWYFFYNFLASMFLVLELQLDIVLMNCFFSPIFQLFQFWFFISLRFSLLLSSFKFPVPFFMALYFCLYG